MQNKTLYRYRGPVFHFNNLICYSYEATTYALSKKQALNNLSYRFKKAHGYNRDYQIVLNETNLSEMFV